MNATASVQNRLSWDGVYKVSGISLFIAGIIPFIYLFFVIVLNQTIPIPAKDTLENPSNPTFLFLLAIVGELLLMPAGLGLYLSLKDVKKTRALIGAALWFLVTPMFLVSRGLIIALSQISDSYLNAASETMKAAYLASAELAIETQSIFAYMGLILLSIASIILGSVMLGSTNGKAIGYLMIAAGIVTLFTPLGILFEIPFIIAFTGVILSAAWQTIVGVKLYRLSP